MTDVQQVFVEDDEHTESSEPMEPPASVNNEEPKSFKEIIALANTEELDYENVRSNKRRSKDNPQVSFRTDEVIYQRLKDHIKHPASRDVELILALELID